MNNYFKVCSSHGIAGRARDCFAFDGSSPLSAREAFGLATRHAADMRAAHGVRTRIAVWKRVFGYPETVLVGESMNQQPDTEWRSS